MRNRASLLVAARQLFTEAEGGVTLDAIAQAAGVGIGTLYRHFPTKEALSEAVFMDELDSLDKAVDPLLARSSAREALRLWMDRYASFVATKHAMHAALRIAMSPGSGVLSETRSRINQIMTRFIAAGAQDGSMRRNIVANDLTLTMAGAVYVATTVQDPEQVRRVLDFIVDGIRH